MLEMMWPRGSALRLPGSNLGSMEPGCQDDCWARRPVKRRLASSVEGCCSGPLMSQATSSTASSCAPMIEMKFRFRSFYFVTKRQRTRKVGSSSSAVEARIKFQPLVDSALQPGIMLGDWVRWTGTGLAAVVCETVATPYTAGQ
jgi:hypothetical protein